MGNSGEALSVRAAALTDCGLALADSELVRRGVIGWEDLAAVAPSPGVIYSLANAHLAIWELAVRKSGPLVAWGTSLLPLRLARTSFLTVVEDASAPAQLRAEAVTNLGNSYDSSGRGLEALQMYDRALQIAPSFGMALGNRGIALLAYAEHDRVHRPHLQQDAYWDLRDALQSPDDVIAIGGKRALRSFDEALNRWTNPPPPRSGTVVTFRDPYQEWCRHSDLFLHVSPRCLSEADQVWDPLFIRSVHMSVETLLRSRGLVPEFFGAFNTLKNDYAAARYLAWLATTSDTHRAELLAVGARTKYANTSDYARYDLSSGLARLAFKAGNDLLDKVGTFLGLLLGLGPKLYFRAWWKANSRQKDNSLHPNLLEALDGGQAYNSGLWALCDLTADLEEGGRYASLEALRHATTHRLVVLHEMLIPTTSSLSDRLVHMDEAQFDNFLVEQLGLARKAMIYLVQAVDRRESEREPGEKGRIEVADWQDYRTW
jgi:tetratricopeptide (TPR) repeat protein